MSVADNGDRVFRKAAAHAEIVAFSGAAPGQRPGMLRFLDPKALTQRVAHVRQAAPHRFAELELNRLVHAVAIDSDRRDAVNRLSRFEHHLSDRDLARVPTVLSGHPAEVAEKLHQHREAIGFTYFTVPEPAMREFARVIAAVRG
ncbi:hypothetical protein ACWEV3_18110 [Saccharopolyspora sp. NPDC003752]